MCNTLHTKTPHKFSMYDSRYNLLQFGKEKVKLFNRGKLPQSPFFPPHTGLASLLLIRFLFGVRPSRFGKDWPILAQVAHGSTRRAESQFIAHRWVCNEADDGLTQDSIRREAVFRIRPTKSPPALRAAEKLFGRYAGVLTPA